MKKKVALITGISGQDGAYLAELLLSKNYTVIGTDRRSARSNYWRIRRLGIEDKIVIDEMEITEIYEIQKIFKKYKNIDEFYNLASQSFVSTSFNSPITTANVTALSVLRILETIKSHSPKTKLYQASSSEMFGDVLEKVQNEKTPFNPQSPYAISKVFGHQAIQNYRKSYNLFCVSGILFNHESPLRGEEFVTRKITLGFVKILKNKNFCIELGNLYAKRDWGYAKEYVVAMWKMMQQKKPDDYVIATNQTASIKEFINEIRRLIPLKTKWIGKGLNEKLIDVKNKRTIIKINKKFFRPAEVNMLKGNSNKAYKQFGWKAKIRFKELAKIMFMSELKNFNKY
jgi:GDPmannose 4,6-dehydratase